MTVTAITGIGRLWTGTDRGVVRDAVVLVEADRILWAGPANVVPHPRREEVTEEVDVGGALVTPGLIDAHTHPVYLRPRLEEVVARSAGLDYRDLDGASGIAATVSELRGADRGEVEAAVRRRLEAWLRSGTTTVEVKTGYHLTREGEIGAVRHLRSLHGAPDIPDLHITFLAAHAIPEERHGDADGYVEEVAGWTSVAAAAGADSCDVFCDVGYFTVAQSRRVLRAGIRAGLVPRIHADELERTGGSQLAAELGCASADHLLRAEAEDARRLARAGVVATLCPTTALAMGTRPDVDAFRDAGTTIALGSDHNPGASGLTTMGTVVALAVWELGLTVEESLAAATAGGAAALRAPDRGVVELGMRGDLVAWDADHEGAFAWSWGLRPRTVWRAGAVVTGSG